MLTTGAPPNILIRANIYNNDPMRYIVLVVSCFVLPIPNIYRDTSVLTPSLSGKVMFVRRGNLGCVWEKEKAESEAQRGKPEGTLESEIRNAIS